MKENVFTEDKDIDSNFRQKLNSFYEILFSDLIKIKEIEKGSEIDKQGIDIVLNLIGEKTIKIQEKIRREDYGDFLIEFWHNKKTSKPEVGGKEGWYQKIQADLIIYIVPDWIYCLWVSDLKNFVKNNRLELSKRDWKKAYNKEGNYWTYNKAIKWEEIPHKKYKF